MFTVKAEQMALLAAESMRRFEERVLAHVDRCLPQAIKQSGRAKLIELIRNGVNHGRKRGLQTEQELVMYIDLSIIFGENFERAYPKAGEILSNDALSGPGKMELLLAFFNDVPGSSSPKGAD
jgi:hypothetical protein